LTIKKKRFTDKTLSEIPVAIYSQKAGEWSWKVQVKGRTVAKANRAFTTLEEAKADRVMMFSLSKGAIKP